MHAEKVPEVKEGHEGPKRVFVEIGPRAQPVTWMGRRHFGENDMYIGIDIDERELRDAPEVTDPAHTSENIHFLAGDARKLPLKENSVHEIYFGNVFGDSVHIRDSDREQFVTEAKRVLKTGGELIIKETASPISQSSIGDLLLRYGFAVEKVIRPTDAGWEEMVGQYDLLEARPQRLVGNVNIQSFLLIARLPGKS